MDDTVELNSVPKTDSSAYEYTPPCSKENPIYESQTSTRSSPFMTITRLTRKEFFLLLAALFFSILALLLVILLAAGVIKPTNHEKYVMFKRQATQIQKLIDEFEDKMAKMKPVLDKIDNFSKAFTELQDKTLINGANLEVLQNRVMYLDFQKIDKNKNNSIILSQQVNNLSVTLRNLTIETEIYSTNLQVFGNRLDYLDFQKIQKNENNTRVLSEQFAIINSSLVQQVHRSDTQEMDLNNVTKKVSTLQATSSSHEVISLQHSNQLAALTSELMDYTNNTDKKMFAEGWSEINGNTYYFSTKKLSWPDAKAFCENIGMKLVIIASSKRNDFIAQQLKLRVQDHMYIGLHDVNNNNNFTWIDGTKPVFTSWNSGEPNNIDGNEDCVAMQNTGGWYDVKCATPNHFICLEEEI